ncbi:hypothetical protein LINGRAHAP2_LOCUS20019 [Linum grandiflorum]
MLFSFYSIKNSSNANGRLT